MGKARGGASRRSFLVHAAPHRRAVTVHEIVQSNRRSGAHYHFRRALRAHNARSGTSHMRRAARSSECHQDCVEDFIAHSYPATDAERPPSGEADCLQRGSLAGERVTGAPRQQERDRAAYASALRD